MQQAEQIENDFYIRTWPEKYSPTQTITFKFPEPSTFIKEDYDWYIIVALEKCEKVITDRHLLTRELILAYRYAIREGYNHQIDPALKNPFAFPKNKNTIKGIQDYIKRIELKSEE